MQSLLLKQELPPFTFNINITKKIVTVFLLNINERLLLRVILYRYCSEKQILKLPSAKSYWSKHGPFVSCTEKIKKIHSKTPVLESYLSDVAGLEFAPFNSSIGVSYELYKKRL